MNKDTRKLLKQLEQQGFTMRRTTGGHMIVYRDGRAVTCLAGTGGKGRGWANSIAELRRAGYDPSA